MSNLTSLGSLRACDAPDGTRLAYVVAGSGPQCIVLAPGLATPPSSYQAIFDHFKSSCRLITWDMRGTFRSAMPKDGVAALTMAHHLQDLEAIVAAEAPPRFVLGGWSAGVQLALAYTAHHLDRVQGLLLLNGGAGHLLDHAFNLPGGKQAPMAALALAKRLAPLINSVAPRLMPTPTFLALLRLCGLVAPQLGHFPQVLREFSQLDFVTYFEMMQHLQAHSAEDALLAKLPPTLVTAGSKDRMTPVASAERMARAISDTRLLILPRGTHYAPIEYAPQVNQAIGDLLSRLGWHLDRTP